MASIPFSPVSALSQGTFFVIALTMININFGMGVRILVPFDLNQRIPAIIKVYYHLLRLSGCKYGFIPYLQNNWTVHVLKKS